MSDVAETLPAESDIVGAVDQLRGQLAAVRASIGQVFFGQADVIDQTLIAMLAGGHALVVGVPGLGKTRLVETIGTVFGLQTKRIQFTPDLMPDDILGSELLETADDGSRHFRFIQGPIFTQLLMADEINRASPRTQSALLQAMQERRVAVAGEDRPLPSPFTVLATQNPIEQEGTYPLPEAQLDRFLFDIRVPYPDRATEAQILTMTTGVEQGEAVASMTPAELLAAQRLVRLVPVGEQVLAGILRLVRAGRPGGAEALESATRHLDWGPGPRAAQALMLAIRARALLQGRYAPSLDDVVALAAPALRHRIGLNYAARAEAVSPDDVVGELLRTIA